MRTFFLYHCSYKRATICPHKSCPSFPHANSSTISRPTLCSSEATSWKLISTVSYTTTRFLLRHWLISSTGTNMCVCICLAWLSSSALVESWVLVDVLGCQFYCFDEIFNSILVADFRSRLLINLLFLLASGDAVGRRFSYFRLALVAIGFLGVGSVIPANVL